MAAVRHIGFVSIGPHINSVWWFSSLTVQNLVGFEAVVSIIWKLPCLKRL